MSERTDIQSPLLVRLSETPGAAFYRNNTGRLPDKNGRWISFGLLGSGDIMGHYLGRATAVECKTEIGRLSTNQKRFAEWWMSRGGVYIVARDVDQAMVQVVDGKSTEI